jgi:spermidine synthase
MVKRIVSYLFPITRRIESVYSGSLEVSWLNGRKILDAANANYSYGALQRVLRFGIQQIDLAEVKNVLLLGLGGGSLVNTLRKEFSYQGEITGVDIDPIIVKIAAEDFGIVEDHSTHIVCMDALDFVKGTMEIYDLTIVDLFIDNVVPGAFLSLEFWRILIPKINHQGFIIFNTISETCDIQPVKRVLRDKGFDVAEYNQVEGINTLLIAKAIKVRF